MARDTFDAVAGLYGQFRWEPLPKEELRHIRSFVRQAEEAGPPEGEGPWGCPFDEDGPDDNPDNPLHYIGETGCDSLWQVWNSALRRHLVMSDINWFSFEGRATRSEFWSVFGILFVAYIIVVLAAALVSEAVFFLLLPLVVVYSWTSLAVYCRRWHDVGKSGWNTLWGLIPLVGIVIFLYLGIQEGNTEDNVYGRSPYF